MKQLVTLLLTLVVSVANSQTTSTNLLTNPTFVGTTGWTATGGIGGNGPTHPAAPANGNGYTFTFSQGTIAQTYAINQALANVGAGVQVAGFDYGFKYRFGCANQIGGYCENPAGIQDTLNATSTITSNTGSTLYTRYYALGANAPAPYSSTFSSVDTQQRFNSAVPVENLGTFKISFTGQDNGYWGGNYGPTIKDVYSKAVYTVDPCMANPASSSNCPGYNNVSTSQNIAAQSYAINQALNLSGAGVQINGVKYGYHYYVGGDWCSAMVDGACVISPSSMAIDVGVSATDGTNIYTATHNHTEQNAGGNANYTYVFPTQRLLSTMGNFSLSTREVGATALYSAWSNWQYTPDPCTVNPLSSTTCAGYAQAYQDQQCAANPLYAVTCSGYAAAYLTQQCTANTLYSASCPGYAVAYKAQQCTANPLYATDCPGYEQAYLNAQCILDSLYSRLCTGYATAYAIKYLTPIDSTTASAVNSSLSTTAAVKASDPVSINTNGTVSTTPSATGDSTVDAVISTPSSTSATSPTSVNSVTNAPPPPGAPAPTARATEQASAPPPPPPPAVQQERAAENKKTEGAVASVERKAGGDREAAKKEATALTGSKASVGPIRRGINKAFRKGGPEETLSVSDLCTSDCGFLVKKLLELCYVILSLEKWRTEYLLDFIV